MSCDLIIMEIILLAGTFLIILSIFLFYLRLYVSFSGKIKCNCTMNLVGKTVLITGGTRGIGLETAVSLAGMGARVLIASSNRVRGHAAVRQIKERSKNRNIVFYELNLEDFASVRCTAENILNNESQLHVLLNNAAISYGENAKAKNGCDKVFSTNYLGHFLLTYLLVDLLRSSAPSRIVNVTTVGCRYAQKGLDFTLQDDAYGSDFFPFLRDYEPSKLALLILTKELNRRLSGFGISTNAVHPGFVMSSPIWTNMRLWFPPVVAKTLHWLAWPLNQGLESASNSLVHAAISPTLEGISGKYLEKCRDTPPCRYAESRLTAARLWSASMLLTGCTVNGQVIPKLRVVDENENKFDEIDVFDNLSGCRKPVSEPDWEVIDRCHSEDVV